MNPGAPPRECIISPGAPCAPRPLPPPGLLESALVAALFAVRRSTSNRRLGRRAQGGPSDVSGILHARSLGPPSPPPISSPLRGLHRPLRPRPDRQADARDPAVPDAASRCLASGATGRGPSSSPRGPLPPRPPGREDAFSRACGDERGGPLYSQRTGIPHGRAAPRAANAILCAICRRRSWPAGLAAFYPTPGESPCLWASASLLVVAFTASLLFRRRPCYRWMSCYLIALVR
jgi:hypothetical protein